GGGEGARRAWSRGARHASCSAPARTPSRRRAKGCGAEAPREQRTAEPGGGKPMQVPPSTTFGFRAPMTCRRARSARAAAFLATAALCHEASAQPGLPFTEAFDDADLRDEAATRADWGSTEPGTLRLPSASPLADPFGAATVAEDMLGAFTTRALAVADLNGDGHADLVEGARGPDGVYLNNGDGTFAARVPLEDVPSNTRGIAAGDLDRDGDIDVVTGNLGATSRVYLNAGDGVTF